MAAALTLLCVTALYPTTQSSVFLAFVSKIYHTPKSCPVSPCIPFRSTSHPVESIKRPIYLITRPFFIGSKAPHAFLHPPTPHPFPFPERNGSCISFLPHVSLFSPPYQPYLPFIAKHPSTALMAYCIARTFVIFCLQVLIVMHESIK